MFCECVDWAELGPVACCCDHGSERDTIVSHGEDVNVCLLGCCTMLTYR
jgi:hypothetical protein